MSAPVSILNLLEIRGRTHGDFSDHARITQSLKDVLREELTFRNERGQKRLTTTQLESLDMIVHKIGRIIAGNSHHRDHWDDIAGYATLVAERCEAPEVAA